MTRRLMPVLIVSVALAGTAWAAFRTGNYKGTTGKGTGVSFTAKAKAVTNFTFSVLLRCANGAQVSNTTTMSRIPIRNDRFNATDGTATVKGELKGSSASGTISVLQKSSGLNNKNCKSGALAWTAKRGGTSNANAVVCAPSGFFNGGDLQVSMSCGGKDFDGFVVRVPRPATRADTSVAHLRCFVGKVNGADAVNCSAQDGVRLKSGQVLIRFTDNATCADANKTTVSALRVGPTGGEDGPFPLRTSGC